MSRGLVERLLAERMGLDQASVGETLIENGVRARMAALGIADRSVYELALTVGNELQALIEEVAIPESWFFRDSKPFEILAWFARSGWLERPEREPLTVLSVPCAGGEEPYSIAVTLIEIGLPPERFRVDAVDISARSLSRAIAATFGGNSFRGASEEFRAKHFREEGGRYTLNPSIRQAVRFRVGNVLDPKLLADRPPFDAVFCRNLLIYFDAPAKDRAFATLGRLTAEGGLLFLGHADRKDAPSGSSFAPLGDKGAFAYRKGPPSKAGETRSREPAWRSDRPKPEPGQASRAVAARPDPRPSGIAIVGRPGPEPAEPVAAPRPPTAFDPGRAIEEATSLADSGRYGEASTLLQRAIAGGLADARAHFLLGMIRQATGERGQAEAQFLKAVYLDPQHDEALTALSLLARRKGDVAAEATYRRRADRVLRRKGANP